MATTPDTPITFADQEGLHRRMMIRMTRSDQGRSAADGRIKLIRHLKPGRKDGWFAGWLVDDTYDKIIIISSWYSTGSPREREKVYRWTRTRVEVGT